MRTKNNANESNMMKMARFESEMAELNQGAWQAAKEMCEVAAKELGLLGPESTERLLEYIFGQNGSTDESAEYAASVLNYYEKIGQKFVPDRHLTVGNFTEISREYARDMLRGATLAKVKDLGTSFAWQEIINYASSIVFVANDLTPLCYVEDGCLQLRTGFFEAEELPKIGIDFDCYEFNVSWGKLSSNGKSELQHFLLTEPSEATHVVICTSWGGPSHKKTRGNYTKLSAADFPKEANCLYTERQESKRGGEGRDYYIIALDSNALKDWSATHSILSDQELAEAEVDFAEKYEVVQFLDRQYKCIEATYQAIDRILEQCDEFKADNKLLAQPFVYAPNFDSLGLPCFSQPNYSLAMSKEELIKNVIPVVEFQRQLRLAELAEVLVSSWKKFAPEYAALHDLIKKNHGTIIVYGDHAEIRLPNNEVHDNDQPLNVEPISRKFAFSAQHLLACHRFLKGYESNERTATKDLAAMGGRP